MGNLQVLAGGQDSWNPPANAGVPNLIAAPFRPGEMPTVVLIELTDAGRHELTRRVRGNGLPAELWLRVAVEAARHLETVSAQTGLDRGALVANITRHAHAPGDPLTPVHGHRHRLYAQELRLAAARRGTTELIPFDLSLRLPDEMLTAWARTAARTGVPLGRWASTLLLDAPEGIAEWEAAATEAGRSLGELIYAAALEELTAR